MIRFRYIYIFAVMIILCGILSFPARVSAGGNSVSGTFKDDRVEKVILQLCQQAGCGAVLDEEIIKDLFVSTSFKNKSLEEALAIILIPFDLTAVPHEDKNGAVCYSVESSRGASKPSSYQHPEFPDELNGPLDVRFENTDLPDALRKTLEANARPFGKDDSGNDGIPTSYTWCDNRMKGIKIGILGGGVELATIFETLLDITGLGYEYKERLLYIAPRGYFNPDTDLDMPGITSHEADTPVWLLYHDKCLNDILDDLFTQVDLEYSSPSVDIYKLKSSVRFDGIPFSTAFEAILLPQRLTYEVVGETIVIKYPTKW